MELGIGGLRLGDYGSALRDLEFKGLGVLRDLELVLELLSNFTPPMFFCSFVVFLQFCSFVVLVLFIWRPSSRR